MIRGHVSPHARGGGAYVHRPCKVIGLFFKGLFEATIFFTVEKGLKEGGSGASWPRPSKMIQKKKGWTAKESTEFFELNNIAKRKKN